SILYHEIRMPFNSCREGKNDTEITSPGVRQNILKINFIGRVHCAMALTIHTLLVTKGEADVDGFGLVKFLTVMYSNVCGHITCDWINTLD
ncbi:unnamed protein product, partial [Allacma fusca]